MIKFFRKIRQRLLTENKFSKYLLYAIGEIVLVVIGILIALSINTRNEEIKNQKKATVILREIRADMLDDIEFVEALKIIYAKRLLNFKKIDRGFYIGNNLQEMIPILDSIGEFNYNAVIDTIRASNYNTIFNGFRSFRSNTSSFDAMISSGLSNLITNRDLFMNIQGYYTGTVPDLLERSQMNNERNNEINFKWSYVIKYHPYRSVVEFYSNKDLIADLNYLYNPFRLHNSLLTGLHSRNLNKIVAEIDKELKSY